MYVEACEARILVNHMETPKTQVSQVTHTALLGKQLHFSSSLAASVHGGKQYPKAFCADITAAGMPRVICYPMAAW